jgi:hypothetical protein
MATTRNQNRPTREERILDAVERCSAVRPCVLKSFYVEDGLIHILLFFFDQHDETGRLVRPAETCRLTIPVSYGRTLARVL